MANQKGMMVPLLASVGIGAAAYYSMTRGKSVGSMAQAFMPFVGSTGNQGQQQNQQQNQFQSPYSSQ
ncbi:hypothetical protein [Aquibacillus salsiterrae]|uniref:Uncharacterized protein n=1 Tax=Aquibacillus salsiterrae TaxID=2950439 RepID=A0A9X3WGH8_9BACI|nr:hypothetical protein [Aquibacillus salsiterrae]MDC3417960.1 hypothetical protein [Aquibacillus salsiterrae]